MYQISITPHAINAPEIFRWCLDFPRDSDAYTSDDLLSRGLLFQGWVLAAGHHPVKPYVKVGENKFALALDRSRPDVVTRVLGEDPEGHEKLECGFRVSVPMSFAEVTFGFEVKGREYDAAMIRVEGEIRILQGAEGWLFLDNDTNQSVEQFRGEYLLGRQALAEWGQYLSALSSLAHSTGCRHAVLVAPAKEMVLPEYYPFAKGEKTPIEQVLELAAEEHRLVYPVAELRAMSASPFRKCDTHWSLKGALTGLLETLRALGLDAAVLENYFSADVYSTAQHSGDLGNKLFPPQSAPELLLRGVPYRKWLVYDNNLPNMGRLMVFRNDQALFDHKCMVFGSSSSYSFFSYITRVFSTLIFVHSAGGIDCGLIAQERPDYVIAQTNARFVVRSPSMEYDLAEEMLEKLSSLTKEEIVELRERDEAAAPLPPGLLNSELPSIFSTLLRSAA